MKLRINNTGEYILNYQNAAKTNKCRHSKINISDKRPDNKIQIIKWVGPLFKNIGAWEAFVAFDKGKWFIDQQAPEFAFTFPFEVTVLTAYKFMPNRYELALNWLPDIELSQNSALEIFDACQTSDISQNIRQATLKYINRWSKERGFQFAKPRC